VSTKRGTCAADEVIATPSIELYRFATSDGGTFQSDMNAHGKTNVDLVIVGTHTMCGDSTHNRVLAYYADTLVLKWTFNASFTKKVDFISDGGAIDYVNDVYYFGTNLASGASQDSLFAISTIDGSLKWSGPAGSIQNRPNFANNKLYVATTSGAVQAYGPLGDGAGNPLALWTTPAQMPGLVTRNIWFETRSGAFQGSFLALDSIGNLRAYHDTGTAASLTWTQVANNASTFTSMPAVFPLQNKAYIGKADGRIIQIDLNHGAWGADAPVAASAATVGDPTLDIQAAAGTTVDTVSVTAGTGVMATFSVNPLWASIPCGSAGVGCSCPTSASCNAAICNSDPCMILKCTGPFVASTCGGVPCFLGHCATNGGWVANGTACDDGKACTCDCSHADATGTCPTGTNLDACWQGHCSGNPVCYSGCTCANVGDPGCGSGNPTQPTAACCGVGGCINFLTDPNNCGECGKSCASGECLNGVCVGGMARCNFATAALLNTLGTSLTGADGLTYDNQSLASAGGTCNAYLSSYRTGVSSPIYEVSPTGTVTTIGNSTGADLTPLHGISVSLQGNQAFAGLVNDQANTLSPELAISVVPSAYSRSGVLPAPAKTDATAPFNDNRFDTGPVGPLFDTKNYDGATNTTRIVYYANYLAAGDLYKLSYGTSWTAAALQKGGVNITFPSRVTAMTFGKRHSNDAANGHRTLAVAFGTRIQLVDLDNGNANDVCDGVNIVNGNNDCVDLSLWVPPTGDTEGPPVKILSLAAHPFSGDFYAEVEDNHSPVNVYVLNVDPDDLSPRRQSDVDDDQHLPPSSFPIILGTGVASEGRITMGPDMSLIHIIPTVNGAPTFTSYPVTRHK
jgi:hypothetical protein